MSTLSVELDAELVTLLEGLERPVTETARELIVLELYRRGAISSGKAAELLGLSRQSFLDLASRLGVPYFRLAEVELEQEARNSESL
jgi:predicted HTH domain antitoxin